jgi:copper chaperone NosL
MIGIRRVLFATFILSAFMSLFALAQDDIQKNKSCAYCGMDRGRFSHTRMLIEYDDGTTIGTCSIHCTALDFALKIDKTPKAIHVADAGSGELIDAEKAIWVIGGNKPGVMTKRAKWAFEKKNDAEKFVKENGGAIATFDEAMTTAYEDMYQDTKMIREKRRMMKMKMMEHKR